MSSRIAVLVGDAAVHVASLRVVEELYPDAREGIIFGTPIIASELAMKDTHDVVVFVNREKNETLLLPYVQVATIRVFGWSESRGTPIDTFFTRLSTLHPDAFEQVMKVLRQ